ncbi:MAG TPA: GtrA family protein [Planctomycetota bacterium]|nr:GtrA family protein [Planctomycetota bacterium]
MHGAGKALWTRLSCPTSRLHVQFLRYIVVGGVATVVDFGVYVLLVRGLGIHYLAGNAAGFSAGLVTNYLLSVWWVFASRRLVSRSAEFVVFAVIGLAGLGISECCMFVGVALLHVNDLLIKVSATICTLLWNFGVRRRMLFRDRSQGDPGG